MNSLSFHLATSKPQHVKLKNLVQSNVIQGFFQGAGSNLSSVYISVRKTMFKVIYVLLALHNLYIKTAYLLVDVKTLNFVCAINFKLT